MYETEPVEPSTLQFLKDLADNNNREWFNAHKHLYTEAQENMCSFIDNLILEMNAHDDIENTSGKKSLFRIYNDVRFSKDKSPYKPWLAFSLQRAGKQKRGGYYMHIRPGNSFLACGFWGPNPEDLKRIRQDIQVNYKLWTNVLHSKNLKLNFGELKGDKVPTVPRGFDKDHAAIDLIRHKQFILRHEFTDKEILSEDFLKEANNIYKSVRPFFDMMSEILTTNVNGESLISL